MVKGASERWATLASILSGTVAAVGGGIIGSVTLSLLVIEGRYALVRLFAPGTSIDPQWWTWVRMATVLYGALIGGVAVPTVLTRWLARRGKLRTAAFVAVSGGTLPMGTSAALLFLIWLWSPDHSQPDGTVLFLLPPFVASVCLVCWGLLRLRESRRNT